MITKNPVPDIVSDPDDLQNPFVYFSPNGFNQQQPAPRNFQILFFPLISKSIHSLPECCQTAELQPKKYIETKIGFRFKG